MKVAIATLWCGVLLVTLQGTDGRNIFSSGWDYVRDFVGGVGDMGRAYNDMRRANTIGADKYFHARGNYDAAQRGEGGRDAAALISDARESWQSGVSGRGDEDTAADQEANIWGREGGDPDRYRPEGLDESY